MTVTEGTATVTVTAHSTAGAPATARMEIWRRRVGDTDVGIRIGLADGAADYMFIDASVASGAAYEYRSRAYSPLGSDASSPWTP